MCSLDVYLILQMKQIGAYAPPFYGALTLSVTLQGSHSPGKSGRVMESQGINLVRESQGISLVVREFL